MLYVEEASSLMNRYHNSKFPLLRKCLLYIRAVCIKKWFRNSLYWYKYLCDVDSEVPGCLICNAIKILSLDVYIIHVSVTNISTFYSSFVRGLYHHVGPI